MRAASQEIVVKADLQITFGSDIEGGYFQFGRDVGRSKAFLA